MCCCGSSASLRATGHRQNALGLFCDSPFLTESRLNPEITSWMLSTSYPTFLESGSNYKSEKSIFAGSTRKPRVLIAAYARPAANQIPPAHFAGAGKLHQIPKQNRKPEPGTSKPVSRFRVRPA